MTMATTSFISGRIRTTPVQRLSLNECEILFNSSVAYQLLKVATFRDTKACDDILFIWDPNALDRPCSPNELYKSVSGGNHLLFISLKNLVSGSSHCFYRWHIYDAHASDNWSNTANWLNQVFNMCICWISK